MFGIPRNASHAAAARHPKRRRALTVFLFVILACCVVWWAIEFLVQVDRYRPLVISKLEETTGMPARIEELDLTLRPLPSVAAYGVSLGEGGFRAEISQVTIRLRLRSLFQRRLDITEIELDGLRLTTPAERAALAAQLQALNPSGLADMSDDGGLPIKAITLDEVRVDNGRVYLADTGGGGDTKSPLYSFDLELQDVLSETVSIDLRGTVEREGLAATVSANGVARRTPDWRLTGTISLHDGDSSMLPELAWLPRSVVELRLALEGTPAANPAAEASGRIAFEEEALSGFNGPFSAKVALTGDTVEVEAFQWTTPAMALSGELTTAAFDSAEARIAQWTLTPAGIRTLASLAPTEAFHIEPQDDAAFEAAELTLSVDSESAVRLSKGSGAFQGVAIILPDGSEPFGEITSRFDVKDGVFTADLSCQGVELTGTVTPDLTTGRVAVDLSGTAELNRDRLARMLALDAVTETAGTVHFNHIRGTFSGEGGVPSDLSIDGTLSKGKLAIKTETFADSWRSVEAAFTAGSGVIDTHVRAESARQGPLEIQGRYDVPARQWHGKISADVERFAESYSDTPERKRYVAAILRAYGSSSFQVSAQLPSEKTSILIVDFERTPAPSLSGHVEFAGGQDGWVLQTSRVNTTIPLAAFASLVPKLKLDGPASATFVSSEGDMFVLDVDLSDASIKTERHIEKKPGGALTVRVDGKAWRPMSLRVACLGESLDGRFDNGRLRVDDLDMELEPFVALLSGGGAASGRITGAVATNPASINLLFKDVTVGVSSELTLASINGRIEYDAERWTFHDLTFRGAKSDCTVNAAWFGDKCIGEIQGEQLDVNALLALYDEVYALRVAGQTSAQEHAATPPRDIQSRFSIALGAIHYRRARIDEARASVLVSRDGVAVKDFAGSANGGLLSGEATVSQRKGAASRLKAALSAKSVDAAFLDEVFFAESREFKGQLDGALDIEMPIGGGVNPWAGLTGTAEFDGSHGTFGKLGLATKVLTVLRTTEVVRLRLPSLKDEGLRFTSCAGRFSAKDGLVTVERFALKNPSLEMRGTGTLDFPKEESDVRLAVNVLEAVTGLVEKVPLVGKAVNRIGEIASVNLHISGPPLNPNVSVAPGERPLAGKAVDVVKDAAKTGEKAGKGLKDRTEGAIRGILGGSGKEEKKEE